MTDCCNRVNTVGLPRVKSSERVHCQPIGHYSQLVTISKHLSIRYHVR